MKQIIQNYRTGELELAEVPIPLCSPNKILVKNITSLISLGTERSIIELGKKSLLGKARARPDLVKRFIDKAQKEGFIKTFKEALGRLDNPTLLGYSSAGIVIEAGSNVHKFSPGNRVACIGAGYASHAEYIAVPENLCCRISDNIDFEEASFGMLGIIALHGVRCANLTFGESVAVMGLGLLGLLTVQILKAYGCKVIGMDIDSRKVDLAKRLGADYAFISDDEFKNGVERVTGGYGADAVIITAATKSDVPINTAVDISRFRGRIVLVGVVDVHPQRNEMWHKEVEIIVSKAGGPGIFDPFYENKGIDYPIGYVRWTENRNLEEFIRLIADKKIDVKPLISHRFKIEQAEAAYKDMLDGRGGTYTAVVLEYPERDDMSWIVGNRTLKIQSHTSYNLNPITSQICVGIIGAGLFGKALLLPALKNIKGIRFHTLSTSSSANAYHTAKKYGFEKCTTDYKEVLKNDEINTVVILTPHGLHARMVIEALKVGKHVYVEKPLCINKEELKEIMDLYSSLVNHHTSLPFLMVGYNRRFSPHAVKTADYLKQRRDPMVINYRVNAGFIPSDHWVHSEEEGGSRIIGEVCHFVDMMQYLTKCNPVKLYAERVSGNNRTVLNSDNIAVTIKFADGSLGNIIYSASGDKAYSREQIEIFCEGKTIVIKDYKETYFHTSGKKRRFKSFDQKMGYTEELQHFFDVCHGRASTVLMPDEIFYSTMAVFNINDSLVSGKPTIVSL